MDSCFILDYNVEKGQTQETQKDIDHVTNVLHIAYIHICKFDNETVQNHNSIS